MTTEQAVKNFVKANEWVNYYNPYVLKYALYIKKEVFDQTNFISDITERLRTLAGLANQYVPHLEGILKQSEIACAEILLTKPNVIWHLLLMDVVLYLSDVEILPYNGDIQVLQDGHRRR